MMAINTTPVTPKVWKRYVDDSFCIIKRNAVDSFHNTLNTIDQHISFTIEEENNKQIAFLDTLVTRMDNALIIDVHGKPTIPIGIWISSPTMTNDTRSVQLRLYYKIYRDCFYNDILTKSDNTKKMWDNINLLINKKWPSSHIEKLQVDNKQYVIYRFSQG